MSASQAASVGVFILVIVLAIIAFVTRLRRRALRQAVDTQASASFQRRIEQVIRRPTETTENPNHCEAPDFQPPGQAGELWPRPWKLAELEAQRRRMWRRDEYYDYWT
jgi:hypothetical protein